MQSAALLKKKKKKERKSKREKSETACMLPLLAGTGERLQSQAPPDPGHPYTSKTSRHVSALLESWAAWTQGCSLGNKMDDRLLPATPLEAVQVGRTFPEPQATRAITGMLCKFSTYQHNGDFPLCDETSSWPQPGQGGSILLLSLWPPDISLLHLQFLWVWSFSYGNRYDKNTCHCEGQQNIICFCKKYQGHPELRNTVAAPAKPAK